MSEEEKEAPTVKVKKAPRKKAVKKDEQEFMPLGRAPYPEKNKYKLTRNQMATLAGKGKSISTVKEIWTGKELNADPRTHYFNVKEV